MADLQAELARFEAEIAGVSTAVPPEPSTHIVSPTQPGPPPIVPQPWQGNPLPQPGPAYAPPGILPAAAPAARGYPPPPAPSAPTARPVLPTYYTPQQPSATAFQYNGIDSSKADLLTGIKAAFESQSTSKKPKLGVARQAAGKRWVDPNLLEWPENDFRIFVGDLGNETNDEVLTKAFARFPTFNKAKVLRDKKTNKTKGFGFVSFTDPIEGAKALREMDGKYVGNRPCKLRKSTWQERSQEKQPFVPGKKKNHIGGGVNKKKGFLHK